jgi:hypothetical protein
MFLQEKEGRDLLTYTVKNLLKKEVQMAEMAVEEGM